MRHKKAIPNRSLRIADQIQRDVSELIRDLKDPRVGMVTVTDARVTSDLREATIFYTVYGDGADLDFLVHETAAAVLVERARA